MEQTAEVERIGVTDMERDLRNGEIGRAEEQFCFIHTECEQALLRRIAEIPMKQADKLCFGVTRLAGEAMRLKIFFRVFRHA